MKKYEFYENYKKVVITENLRIKKELSTELLNILGICYFSFKTRDNKKATLHKNNLFKCIVVEMED